MGKHKKRQLENWVLHDWTAAYRKGFATRTAKRIGGPYLVSALNGKSPHHLTVKSAERIRNFLLELQEIVSDDHTPDTHDWFPGLNALLKQYPWTHNIYRNDFGWPELTRRYLGRRPELEAGLVEDVIDLAREGLLERIRQCACGEWFFAKRNSQVVHHARCRQKKYSSSRRVKKHRRAYMNWYYAMYQSPNAPPPRKRLTFEQWCALA